MRYANVTKHELHYSSCQFQLWYFFFLSLNFFF